MAEAVAKAKTIRTSKLGKRELRLVEMGGKFHGLSDGTVCATGSNADAVWDQLHRESGKSDPKYFGYKDARSYFLKFFPNGFDSDGYRGEERDYKLAAKSRLDSGAPLDSAIEGKGLGEIVLSAYQATNLLSHFEKIKLQEPLRSEHADKIVQASAIFTLEPDKKSLARLEAVLKPFDCAKWTVATYLPFLWQPDRHMFLKPEATKDYAARVGHPFASVYDPRLNIETYQSLIDLVEETAKELKDIRPVDRIDIQSFIWVVGDYQEGREGIFP